MAVVRSEIERALDEIISNENGLAFQTIAVILAKQKWPELTANERKKDLGLDAYVSAKLASDGFAKGVACSITATLAKIKSDAKKAKINYPDLSVLIFSTPRPVTNQKSQSWKAAIQKEFGLELSLVTREEFVTTLLQPQFGALCRGQLGIPLPLERTNIDQLAVIRAASGDVIRAWEAQPRFADKPYISLSSVQLRSDGSESGEFFQPADINDALARARRVVLEAPAGRGKTTTLVQLAKKRAQDGQLSFLVDLPDWVRAGVRVFEFIARTTPFLSRNVTAQQLASAASEQPAVFFLNGWNEISEIYEADALRAIRALERELPGAGILVATRSHTVEPPFPGSLHLKLMPLTRAQRASYMDRTLASQENRDLRSRLQANSALDDLTRTPLFLAEVVNLAQSKVDIPETRVGVLEAVTKLVAATEPHKGALAAAPLSGLAPKYLVALAAEMTRTGTVVVPDEAARRACSLEARKLMDDGQITSLPDPFAVLGALCSHHVLERVEYPSVAYRFEHQQFQEFYASQFLSSVIDRAVRGARAEDIKALQREYLNHSTWTEPLLMVAENIGVRASSDTSSLSMGKLLLTACLDIDPIFASELARLAGPTVWNEVAGVFRAKLRTWYASATGSQRECAVAAMLETGAPDFQDIIVPLLGSNDTFVRHHLHLSTLGPDWVKVVLSLPEDRQAHIVFDLMRSRSSIDAAEELLAAKPSPKVKAQLVDELFWFGDSTALVRHLKSLSDDEFALAVKRFDKRDVPVELWSRVVEACAKERDLSTEPISRLRILNRMNQFGDEAAGSEIRRELGHLRAIRAPDVDQHFLIELLGSLAKTDPAWVSERAVALILGGALWADHAKHLITDVPDSTVAQLLAELEAAEVEHMDLRRTLAVLEVRGGSGMAEDAFVRLFALRKDAGGRKDAASQKAYEAIHQLETLLRRLSAQAVVDGFLAAARNWSSVAFEQATHFFGILSHDDVEVLDIGLESRQALRKFLQQGVEYALGRDDFSGELKATLAIALARVGEAADVAEIQKLIAADIARVTTGRAERAKGKTSERANGAVTVQWHRLVRALEILGREASEATLLGLLEEPYYDAEAAAALVRFARVERLDRNAFVGQTAYQNIWQARTRPETAYHADLKHRYSRAIRHRIEEGLNGPPRPADSWTPATKIKELSYQLATLDGASESELVLRVQAMPPSEWNGWARAEALKALLFSGAVIPLADAANVLDPVLEPIISRGYLSNQDESLINRCLSIFAYVREQAEGIEKIRHTLGRLKLSVYQLGDLLAALSASRTDEGAQLLLDLANSSENAFATIGYEWITALAVSDTKRAREIILSTILADDTLIKGLKLGSLGIDERLATAIAQIARSDQAISNHLLDLSTKPLSLPKRYLLARIYANLGSEDAALATLDLSEGDDAISSNVVGRLFVSEVSEEGSSSFTTMMPRASNDLRAKLFDLAHNDSKRRRAAVSVLGNIELSRYERGRPLSEPRHPDLDSGKKWPIW